MNKRYQVFISSTFRDLIAERQAVQRAILGLTHFPAGMELFPATDASAWELIEAVIDASDYYVLIIGGRYGSLDETGIGYTEKEYDYAHSTKKPIVPLLHKNPDNLPRDRTETEGSAWQMLLDFRKKVEKRHTCVYWTSPDELQAQVILGLNSAFLRKPGIGWIRANEVPSDLELKETLAMRRKITELEQQIATSSTEPPPGSDSLLQGNDEYPVEFKFDCRDKQDSFGENSVTYEATIQPTWNGIFAAVAPSMINEAQDFKLRTELKRYFGGLADQAVRSNSKVRGKVLSQFRFEDFSIDTCVVQFRALGLIRESKKSRSVKDSSTYWTLTPFGDYQMVQLRALRRKIDTKEEGAVEITRTPGN